MLPILDFTITYQAATQQNDSFKDYLALLSPLLVVITFVINYYVGLNTRREERKRSWYYKAFLEPSVKKVDEFFLKTDTVVSTAWLQFKSVDFLEKPAEQKQEAITKFGEDFADLKRKFLFEVIVVLKVSYPLLFSDIEDQLLDLEDEVSLLLSIEIKNDDDLSTFLNHLYAYKGILMSNLSEPALGKSNKTKWFSKS